VGVVESTAVRHHCLFRVGFEAVWWQSVPAGGLMTVSGNDMMRWDAILWARPS
jgi:hypothetical protein